MPRSRFLRSAPVALLFLGAPIVAACGGHVIPIGSNSSALKSVNPSDVSGNAAACPAGYAHPNVCCETSANAPSQCGAWIEHPFQACEQGWTTFPNPLSCCSLKDDKDCIDTPTDAGVPAPPPYGCGYVCPPGYYVPPGVKIDPSQGECCATGPDGKEECFGWATASAGSAGTGTAPSSDPPCAVDAGPAPLPPDPTKDGGQAPDAGVDDGGTAPDDAGPGVPTCPPPPPPPPPYDGGPYGMCGTCPPGWTSDPKEPDLCCMIDAKGIYECFSQATGPVSGPPKPNPPPPTDAGVPTPPVSVGCGGSADGASCSCEWEANNQKDVIDCTTDASGTTTCFCTVDGKSVGQITPGPVCQYPDKLQGLYSSCFGQ